MAVKYRFGEYQRGLAAGHREVSFNDLRLGPGPESIREGKPLAPESLRVKLTGMEIIRL